MSQERRGLTLELRAGEKVELHVPKVVDSDTIVLILERKDGQKARFRIQADPNVKVVRPERKAA